MKECTGEPIPSDTTRAEPWLSDNTEGNGSVFFMPILEVKNVGRKNRRNQKEYRRELGFNPDKYITKRFKISWILS